MPNVKKSKSGSKKATTKQAKGVVKAAKMLMLKSVETKQFNFGTAFSFNDNDINTVTPTQWLVQGNSAVTRVGDSVLLESLTMNLTTNVLAAIYNAKIRIIVGWSSFEVANTTFAANQYGQTEFFYPTTLGTVPNTHRLINTNSFSAIYDEVIDINSNTATGKDIRTTYVRLGMKMKKFDYSPAGAAYGKNKNLVVLVCGHIPSGAFGAALGQVAGTIMLKYKDP